MRTRTWIAGATFLAAGIGAGKDAAAQLRGSDTLHTLTTEVINHCAGIVQPFNYVGGGSSTGQNAMTSNPPLQHVSPMSRELNSGACPTPGTLAQNAQQLLVALDGLAVVAANQIQGDSLAETANLADDCSDGLTGFDLPVAGCTAADGCAVAGTYHFNDWKDVLAQIYGGQTHNAVPTLVPSSLPTDPVCPGTAGRNCLRNDRAHAGVGNPYKIDCDNPVRRALALNWGTFIRDTGAANACKTGNCTKLKHAFRRDDSSGTTDTFLSLVGMIAMPNNTTAALVGGCEVADGASTAGPFCNSGIAPSNKGFGDNLDLDPIRRAADTGPAPQRLGFEQVSGRIAPPTNNDAQCGAPAQIERSCPQGRGLRPAGGIANAALLAADMATQGCVGLVVPISIPVPFAMDAAYPPIACDVGVRQAVIPAPGIICPDGTNPPCALPIHVNPDGTSDFNCYVDRPTGGGGSNDWRVFNMYPVDSTGHMATRLDNYDNPNINGTAERRFSKALYRLHATSGNNNAAVGGPALSQSCKTVTGAGLGSDTLHIGCLVKASPCSIGFAGREAVDSPGPTRQNFAMRLADIQASTPNIENLVLTPAAADDYPMARKLWFNSFVAAGGTAFVTGMTANELALSDCYGLNGNTAIVDAAALVANFVPVPASVTRLNESLCP